MFSKKLVWAMFFGFLFVSFAFFYGNLPAPKNKRVYEAILPYFPYKIKKELGGIDIVDTRKNEDLDVNNAQAYIVYDELLKKWGKKHLRLQGDTLLIYDDQNNIVKKLSLSPQEKAWVQSFFFSQEDQGASRK